MGDLPWCGRIKAVMVFPQGRVCSIETTTHSGQPGN
jgi:hypothetical protein